jgi:hypothetical protein
MHDLETSDLWLAGLKRLNAVVDASGEALVGNLCYDHLQEDYVESPPNPILRYKRDRLRQAVEGRVRMLEVGVNGGHSAYLALTANPKLEFHGIDICEHAYVLPVVVHLEKEFPGRFFFYRGDCLQVLPRLAKAGEKFDIFHIDGAKRTYLEDVFWCANMVTGESARIIMDDTDQKELAWAWKLCIALRVIDTEPNFTPMASETRYRNEVGVLRSLSSWKRPVLRAIVDAAALAYRARKNVQTVAVRPRTDS